MFPENSPIDHEANSSKAFVSDTNPVAVMNLIDLRPCPFCAHDKPVVAVVGRGKVERIAVTCPECSAVGPIASAADPPGHAQLLWNARYARDQ